MAFMLNMKPVAEALKAAAFFSDGLIEDLEIDGQGFTGWQYSFLESATASEVADYIVGSAQAVGSNLQAVAVHLQSYEELRYQQDSAMRLFLSQTGKPYPEPQTDQFNEKELRLDAVERAYYVTVGSVLDCLTALLIGLAGLDLDMHRADSGVLLPMNLTDEYPTRGSHKALYQSLLAPSKGRDAQVKAIRAIATAFTQSGPQGWLDWVLGMRNMVVHREHRGEIVSLDQQKDHSYVISRYPPSNPNLSNLQGFRAGGDKLDALYLHEDLLSTLKGVTSSLNAAVAAGLQSLSTLWSERKMDSSLILQPAGQWRPRDRPVQFTGYQPQSGSINGNTSLTLNPADWKRLIAGGVGETP